jgi:hypothetical protein
VGGGGGGANVKIEIAMRIYVSGGLKILDGENWLLWND